MNMLRWVMNLKKYANEFFVESDAERYYEEIDKNMYEHFTEWFNTYISKLIKPDKQDLHLWS